MVLLLGCTDIKDNSARKSLTKASNLNKVEHCLNSNGKVTLFAQMQSVYERIESVSNPQEVWVCYKKTKDSQILNTNADVFRRYDEISQESKVRKAKMIEAVGELEIIIAKANLKRGKGKIYDTRKIVYCSTHAEYRELGYELISSDIDLLRKAGLVGPGLATRLNSKLPLISGKYKDNILSKPFEILDCFENSKSDLVEKFFDSSVD